MNNNNFNNYEPPNFEDIFNNNLNQEKNLYFFNNINKNTNKNNSSENKKEKIRKIEIDSYLSEQQYKIIISDIEIFFPYKPYANQIKYMEKVIETFQKKSIAGLESPTGTGKTLCLLCASLAYLKNLREKLLKEQNENPEKENNDENFHQPVIFYTSRTHSQLSNAIKELNKTCYRPINSFYGSRDKLCVNKVAEKLKGSLLNQKCIYLDDRNKCFYKNEAMKIANWSSYDGKTADEMKKIGKKRKFCPYTFEKDKCQYADIIFLPYNYIFDFKIFRATALNLKNSIIIVDEAHNLQDICSDSFSADINYYMIDDAIKDLIFLKNCVKDKKKNNFLNVINNNENNINVNNINSENNDNKFLDDGKDFNEFNFEENDIINEITALTNLKNKISNFKILNIDQGQKLEPNTFFNLIFNNSKNKKYSIQNKPTQDLNKSLISNDTTISESSINNNNNENIQNLLKKEIKIEPEYTNKNILKHTEFLCQVETYFVNDLGKGTFISSISESLEIIGIISQNYYKSKSNKTREGFFINNFRFFINQENNNNRTLHIFCFNPGIGFNEILEANEIISMILTSGTLSPIESLESELETEFEIKLENGHIINNKQVHFCSLFSSPFNSKINFEFSYENRPNDNIKIELGKTLIKLCEITPGGILIFFTSFNVMNSHIELWEKNNIISEIQKYKIICKDLRNAELNKKELEKYYEYNSNNNYKGAILFSVCRGTCSEGVNFNDNFARLVIVVGIPYANIKEPKIYLKKDFQEEYNQMLPINSGFKKGKKKKGLDWYVQKALSSVNQAIGRVIRHINDYGAILLIDSRYKQNLINKYISLWLRKEYKIYMNGNLEDFFKDMKNFFKVAQKFIGDKILCNNDIAYMKGNFKQPKKNRNNDSKFLGSIIDELEIEENNKTSEKHNIFVCCVCFRNSDDDQELKFSITKCGHICCQSCWNKINDLKPEFFCPFCKKNLKKRELVEIQ